MKDRDIVRISRLFPLWVVVSLLAPAIAGGLLTMSWQGAATAFFWGALVRVSLLHHVTWSINSICHTLGERPFVSRDKSANVWWLAIPSMGESWHNLHHADPTCARHGVMPGQLDASARVIWLLERAGWVSDVRWPVAERINARLAA
jgi:stearoyl-CoA desaturase (delta-9 desaturase)